MPESSISKIFKTQEECQPETAHINGAIPDWVRGTFIRTGPGKFDFDNNFTMNHVFDGLALLSKFDIKGDSITFQKKYLESESYKRAMVAQKPVMREYGTTAFPDPAKSRFSRLMPSIIPELTDNGNVNVYALGKQIFATGEYQCFNEINPSTLKCCDRHDASKIFGTNTASAHPLTDEDGTTYNVGLSFLTGLKYNIIKIPAPASNQSAKDIMKKSKILCSVPSSSSTTLSYSHSFGLTKNYIILIESPYVITVSKVLGAVFTKGDSMGDWMEWRPEMKNKFIIIEKETGKIVKTEYISEEAFFFLHIINCYEENGQIIIDLSSFPNANFLLEDMNLRKLREGDNKTNDLPCGKRFVVPLEKVKSVAEGVNLVEVKSTATAVRVGSQIILTPEILVEETGLELPTINKKYLGKKANFYYATGSASVSYFQNSVCKVDIKNKENILWRENENYYLGEPTFVANPKGVAEDDGVLVVTVSDAREDHNDFILFLDAKNMKELGRCQFKANIPYAIHGLFLNS